MSIWNKGRKTKGITFVILVLLILTGIEIYNGINMIRGTKLEELKTNMLYLEAKARQCVEDATFKMGKSPDDAKKESVRNEVYIENAKLQKVGEGEVPSNFSIEDTSTCYWLTAEAKDNWGLNELTLRNGERYLIQFDEVNVTVEIYSTIGYNGQYSLSALGQIKE